MTTLFANGQHEDLGGGVFRTTLGLRPVNYLSGGVYLPIVNDWVDGDQDSPHIVSAAPMRVRADGAGRRNLYPIPGNDEVYISIGRPWAIIGGTWQPAPLNPLERVNNRLQSINNNYNLYLDHAGHYAKLGILLKNGFVPAQNRFGFPAALVGLTRQGSTILYNGQPVMTIRPPVVYDWQNPDDVRPITFNFTSFGGQTGVIFILPDLTGMGLPLVDPTLTLQPDATAGLDAYMNARLFTTNTGAQTDFRIGRRSVNTDIFRALIKFDLSSLPDAAVISSTLLGLYALTDDSATATTCRVYRLKRSWPELAVTWERYDGVNFWQAGGAFGANDSEQSDIGSRSFTASETLNEFKNFTLTPTTKAGLDLGNGWLMKFDEEVAASAYHFATSDHATAANRPKLVIDYTLPAGGLFWPGVLSSAIFDGAIVR